jgi:hypothetical protein
VIGVIVAGRLGPALVLRLQDAAGIMAEGDQGCEPFASHGAVGFEQRAAIDDRLGASVDHGV